MCVKLKNKIIWQVGDKITHSKNNWSGVVTSYSEYYDEVRVKVEYNIRKFRYAKWVGRGCHRTMSQCETPSK